MIEISLWRSRIGQFAHHHHCTMSLRLVLVYGNEGHSRPCLIPVCVLVIAVILLMGGDVEKNPGPNGTKGWLEQAITSIEINFASWSVSSKVIEVASLYNPAEFYPRNHAICSFSWHLNIVSRCNHWLKFERLQNNHVRNFHYKHKAWFKTSVGIRFSVKLQYLDVSVL